MIQDLIHKSIVENCDAVVRWFDTKQKGLAFPIYGSFDVRDSGWKVAPVDANIFPAGFNNICQVDKDNAPEIAKTYLEKHYGGTGNRIGLLCEEHTANAFYWENILTLYKIFWNAGRDVLVCMPRKLEKPLRIKASSGEELEVHGVENKAGQWLIDGQAVDLIVCNNDFSLEYEELAQKMETPMNPPHELGWYRRRKDTFFANYNQLAREFAEIISIDSRILELGTKKFIGFDPNDESVRDRLASDVDQFLISLRGQYQVLGIETEPFCFIKNNAGTYGLAVTQVRSGDDIRSWNSKIRKKMKAAKGGREVDELIIQEGIPTRFVSGDETAEPCIYMLGRELIGGFLRTHSEKGPNESLNSPGAVFKRLCVSDLQVDMQGCPMENVYGWTAKLGMVAVALEAQQANVKFHGYTP